MYAVIFMTLSPGPTCTAVQEAGTQYAPQAGCTLSLCLDTPHFAKLAGANTGWGGGGVVGATPEGGGSGGSTSEGTVAGVSTEGGDGGGATTEGGGRGQWWRGQR